MNAALNHLKQAHRSARLSSQHTRCPYERQFRPRSGERCYHNGIDAWAAAGVRPVLHRYHHHASPLPLRMSCQVPDRLDTSAPCRAPTPPCRTKVPKVRHAVSCPLRGVATCPNMTTSAVPLRACLRTDWRGAIQCRAGGAAAHGIQWEPGPVSRWELSQHA